MDKHPPDYIKRLLTEAVADFVTSEYDTKECYFYSHEFDPLEIYFPDDRGVLVTFSYFDNKPDDEEHNG